MAVPQFRYPLDKTGENPNNYVGNERHSLNPQSNLTNVRVLAPNYGPFFSESLRIVDLADGRTLTKDIDYKVTDLLQDASLSFAKPIGQFAVIINGYVSNEVSVSYQVLGGNYQNDATAVQHVFETFLNDTRPVDWSNISGKPLTYPPSLHLHLLEDIIGFGPVIVALEQIKDAILLSNTPVLQSLIDWVNTRKVPWESIVGRPDFVDELTRTVPNTREIKTPAEGGLTGGGDLTVNRSLSLQQLFTSEQDLGSPSESLAVTVDIFGRVKSIRADPISLKWSDLKERPTTLEAMGITDAVSLTKNETVFGEKTFQNALLAKQSRAQNQHDTQYSPIVTQDSLAVELRKLTQELNKSGALRRYFFSQM